MGHGPSSAPPGSRGVVTCPWENSSTWKLISGRTVAKTELSTVRYVLSLTRTSSDFQPRAAYPLRTPPRVGDWIPGSLNSSLWVSGFPTDRFVGGWIPLVQANKNIKLRVSAGGDIIVDGQPVTPEQLATKLADLKQSGGSVWYHRESPAGEPHPNATTVIALVAANKLPIRLSAQPDFSDAVDDKGVSHPGVCLPDSGRQPIPRQPTARAYWHQRGVSGEPRATTWEPGY